MTDIIFYRLFCIPLGLVGLVMVGVEERVGQHGCKKRICTEYSIKNFPLLLEHCFVIFPKYFLSNTKFDQVRNPNPKQLTKIQIGISLYTLYCFLSYRARRIRG